jgi:phenylacetate-CoA ligase
MHPRDNPKVKVLMHHAAQFTPYYRDSGWAYRLRQGLDVSYDEIPLTEKRHIQAEPYAFLSEALPAGRGGIVRANTSGSTGMVMPVFRDEGHNQLNIEENSRLRARWGTKGLGNELFVIMPNPKNPPGTLHTDQRSRSRTLFRFHMLSVPHILDLVIKNRCEVITCFGTIADALMDHAKQLRFVKVISTWGDQGPPNLRERVRKISGCRYFDSYGSEECGLIAVTCGNCGQYHLAYNNVALEVIDDEGHTLSPGGIGRAVLTSIGNYAMPLLRYDIRDYVKLAAVQTCGEVHPVLDRIVGRERMLFKLPGGGRALAAIKSTIIIALGIQRFKLVQTGLTEVELRYQLKDPAARLSDETVDALIKSELNPAFSGKAVWAADFPRAASGKYLMHESLV